jgi:hypothetical protein
MNCVVLLKAASDDAIITKSRPDEAMLLMERKVLLARQSLYVISVLFAQG